MPLDSVPWFVGGGAQHSPEVARLLAYSATSGSEGVVRSPDLKVVATGTPSAQVQVRVGAGIILNRAVGGDLQSYIARNPTATTVSVAATSSSGGRSDLIVLQVEDPFMSGEPWQDPADVTVGPYVFVRVIPNVPNTTTRLQDVAGYAGRSAITLARIDIPASTATITNAMIKDMRKMARRRSERQLLTGDADAGFALTSSTFTSWPAASSAFSIDIPEWATSMTAKLELLGGQTAAQVSGELRLVVNNGDYIFGTYAYNYSAQTNQARQPVIVAGDLAIPSALQGTTATLRMSGRRSGGSGNLFTVDSTYYLADVQFTEKPI